MQQVLREWRAHATQFPYQGYDEPDMCEYLDIWASSISHTMQSAISLACEEILYRYLPERQYGLYADWLSTIGIVPVQERHVTQAQLRERSSAIRSIVAEHGTASPLTSQSLSGMIPAFERLVNGMTSAEIPNCGDVYVTRRRDNGLIRAFRGNAEIGVYTYVDPLAYDDGHLVHVTPVAHLYKEICRYDSLCRHQKVCQLLNTRPVKVVTTSRHESNSKKIVEMMERHDKTSDAKKTLIKFLLNISESKSRIGIEDSVESFIQDITPSIVDQNRLMPMRGPNASAGAAPPYGAPASADRDVRDLFRKQVIKCMEEQIQSQMDEIQDLRLLNQAWERKAEELKSTLDKHGHDLSQRSDGREDLDRLPVTEAVRTVQNLPPDSLSIDDNALVANSFLSQYIPNCDKPEQILGSFWETEYIRAFKLKKLFTNQGTEENISYSNYTVERILTPFLTHILKIPGLGPIPEDCLYLSLPELVDIAYRDSRLNQYVRFVCNREIARRRWESRRADPTGPTDAETGATPRRDTTSYNAVTTDREVQRYISGIGRVEHSSPHINTYEKLRRLKDEQNVQRPVATRYNGNTSR